MTTFLIAVLFLTLAAGLVMCITLFFKKKDGATNDRIVAIASAITSVSTIVVGIATVYVMTKEAERDELRNQPLYTVSITPHYSLEESVFDNEEFAIYNAGEKTKGQTAVDVFSYLVIEFSKQKYVEPIQTKYCPLIYYFGASIPSGALNGIIVHSELSGNNLKLYNELYNGTLEYEQNHPGVFLHMRKEHYFKLQYTDIYGESHMVIKKEDSEIDEKQLIKVQERAEVDAYGLSFDIKGLDLNVILKTCFPEAFEN